MTKDYFFKINDEYIYLDIELINFNDIPVLFICKSNKNYYLALCFDVFDEKYIVIQVKRSLLLKMLDQKITMREIFHTVDSFWEIVYGETPEQDLVKEKAINDIDESVLPIEGEVYEVFDDDVKEYQEQLLTDSFVTSLYRSLNECSVTIGSELRTSKTDVDDYDERFNGYSSIINGCDVPVIVKPKKEIINKEIDISNKEFDIFIEKGSDAA